MSWDLFLQGSLAAGLALFVINVVRDAMKTDRMAVARLRTMLLDLDKMEECAREYCLPASPKVPAYRLPTALVEGCVLWFAEGVMLKPGELKELHAVLIAASEVNRCLEQVHVAATTAPPAPGSLAPPLDFGVEVSRTLLKCELLLNQTPKARTVATEAIARFRFWNEE